MVASQRCIKGKTCLHSHSSPLTSPSSLDTAQQPGLVTTHTTQQPLVATPKDNKDLKNCVKAALHRLDPRVVLSSRPCFVPLASTSRAACNGGRK